MKIQRLFIYPVKSLQPVEVSAAELTNEGLRFDRQYVLTKAPSAASPGVAEHISIKKYYELALFRTSIDQSWSRLTITHIAARDDARLVVPLTPSPLSLITSPTRQVSIFGTVAPGIDMGNEPSRFFSGHLGFEVRLLYIGGSGRRDLPGANHLLEHDRANVQPIDDRLEPQSLRFADAAPLLLTTSASEQDARIRLPEPYCSEDIVVRFRPNIHVDVLDEVEAYDEDYWTLLTVHSHHDEAQDISVRCLFRTVRCLSINADLHTGKRAAAPGQLFGLLAKDRRVNDQFPTEFVVFVDSSNTYL